MFGNREWGKTSRFPNKIKNFKKGIDKPAIVCYTIDTVKRRKEIGSMMYEIYEDWYEAYLEAKAAANEEEE